MGQYVNLAVVAKAMGVAQRVLVAAARDGRFAPVLRVSERTYVVRDEDLRKWERRAEVSPATAGMRPEFLDTRPAEPFAEETAAGTPAETPTHRPGRLTNAAGKVARVPRRGKADRP